MNPKKPRLDFQLFALSACLALVSIGRLPTKVEATPAPMPQALSNHWEIAQFDSQPGTSPPTAGGGTRGDCINSATPLTALIPGKHPALTVSDNPTVMVYIPETSAKTAEFVLKDDRENDIIRKKMLVPASAGIVEIQLTNNAQSPLPLEVGKNYHWYLALVCKPEERREDVFVDGWIQKTTLKENVAQTLEEVSQQERPRIYAKNGIWYEAVSSLAELRRSNPNDTALNTQWKKLLESVGLTDLAEQPLVQ